MDNPLSQGFFVKLLLYFIFLPSACLVINRADETNRRQKNKISRVGHDSTELAEIRADFYRASTVGCPTLKSLFKRLCTPVFNIIVFSFSPYKADQHGFTVVLQQLSGPAMTTIQAQRISAKQLQCH
jgi:hypothetical protein